jgi:hypothetical protein
LNFRTHRSLLLLAAAIAATPSLAQEQRRDRREIQSRINKVWDQQIERMQRARIEAQCKEEAKHAYSAIRFNKRRTFAEECIKKASVGPAPPPLHQPN